jgi:hypothetical protein
LSSPEDFIRNLRVSYENENEHEIKIKEYNKRRKTINLDFLSHGQRETFIKILSDSGCYFIGKAGGKNTLERQIYDRKQKLLKSINKNLIDCINKKISFQFPETYKLYELHKAGGTGCYKFKFQVEEERESYKTKYERYEKNDLLNVLHGMAREYSNKPENYLKTRINIIKNVLIKKDGMTEEEIREFIDPSTDEEEILKYFSDYRYEEQKKS